MKRFKYFLAIVLAFAMTIGNVTPAKALTADSKLEVSGLENGDTVNFYQVLTWDKSVGWKKTTTFNGLTDAQFTEIVGTPDDPATTDVDESKAGSISYATANAIAGMVSGTAYATETAASNKVTVDNPDAGLYVAIITPAAGSPYIYTPVFVAADFEGNNSSNVWAVSLAKSYSDKSVAKKSKPGVDKYTKAADDADASWGTHTDTESTADKLASYVGKKIDFKVETEIPVFAKSLTNPQFIIKDTVDAGIQIDPTTVTVNYEGVNAKIDNYSTAVYKTLTATATTIQVEFQSTELAANAVPTSVTITYQGVVTDPAAANVTELDNDVVINFTNGPSNSLGVAKDETNHYTFSIGGTLFGQESKENKTYEVVKIGVDRNGDPVEEEVFIDAERQVKKAALAGAKFGLYTDSGCTNQIAEFTTGADGIITFDGLDATTYYLKEISAPDGYIKDNNTHTITIAAQYQEQTVNESIDPATGAVWDGTGTKPAAYVDVTYRVDTLTSYTVTVDGHESSYTFTADGPDISTITKTIVPTDIVNTLGTELPSTGGIGTTIFYVVGGAMVICGFVMLVTKRRLAKIDE